MMGCGGGGGSDAVSGGGIDALLSSTDTPCDAQLPLSSPGNNDEVMGGLDGLDYLFAEEEESTPYSLGMNVL